MGHKKSYWETDDNFLVIDKFCWSVRDRIANLVQLASEAKPAETYLMQKNLCLKSGFPQKIKK